jgi:microsomal dipeptidase-like Zn-dependent dipeptidase
MACMGANEEPCDQGYRFIGDGVANTGIGTCVYNGYIDEPTTNSTITEVPDQNDRETLWGWADVHEHQFANLAYGGLVNWGSVFDERGVNAALAKCDFTHDFEVNTPEIQDLATFAVDKIIPQGFVSDAVDNEILPVLGWINDNLVPLGLFDEINFDDVLGIYDDFYDISLANYIYDLTGNLSGSHVPHDILGRGAPVHGDPYVTQWLMGLTNNVSTNKIFEGFDLGFEDLFEYYGTETSAWDILKGTGFLINHPEILTGDYYASENFFELATLGSPNYDPGPQHQVDGIPTFNGWPHFLDGGHQQMYYKWLERAYEGGMRLLVNLAVNNKVLCNLSFTRDKHKYSRDPDGNEIAYSCEDMSTADDQIEAMKALEKFIDDENNGDGWYRIAESAAHAREIIRDGDMAVIIGIEVDTLVGCLPDSEEKCTKEYIEQQVEDYYEKGVRYLFSIHGFDNIFAGPALYNDIFVYANLVVNHDRVDFWDCSAEPFNYTYKLVNDEGHGLGPLGWFYETLNDYYSLPTIPDYDAHCNRRGLTEIGEVLVKAMMKNHMIFDIDHLSEITMHGLKGKKFTRLAQTHKLLSDYDLTDSIRKYVKDRDGLTIPVDGVTITQDDINEFFQEFANPELPSDEGVSEAGLAAYPLSTLIKKYKINEDEDDLVLKIKTEIYEKYGVVDSEIIAIKEAIILRDGLTIPVEEVEITEDDIYEFVGITNVAIEEIVHLTENDINAFIQEYDLPDPVETEVTDIEIEEFLAHYGLADLMDQFPKGVLDIAEQYNYPVNSSHAGLNYDKLTHEYNLTLEEAIRIRNLGGVISLSMPRSIKGTTNLYISGNSWDKDTKTYVNKMYGYKEMVKFMRGDLHGGDWELEDKDFPAIASASDIGAFLDQIGPRFRRAPSEDESIYNENGKYYNLHREATLNEAVLNSDNGIFYVDTTPPLEYPFAAFDGSGNTFSEQVTGERIFDFNVDGLAHVGLFPDLFADVRNIVENNPDDYLVDDPDSPLSSADTYLDPIFNSAEAFVRMWEKIDAFVALPPTITPTITGIQGDNGWYTSDVTIVWNVESDFSVDSKTGCETVIIDYDTPSTTLTCQAENVGGVSEESVTIKRDTELPQYTAQCVPDVEWTNQAVQVEFNAWDVTSGLASPTPVQITVDQECIGMTVFNIFTDNAGLETHAFMDGINIDWTPPVIELASRLPAPNAGGWNNTVVHITYSAVDNLSGIDLGAGDLGDDVVAGEGAGQSVSGTTVDLAGNEATVTVDNINIDTTMPIINITTPVEGVQYVLFEEIIAEWSASDVLSGIDYAVASSENETPVNTDTVGIHAFVVEAFDNAGNTTNQVVAYEVLSALSATIKLQDTVAGFGLPKGTAKTLNGPLKGAIAALKKENDGAAEKTLDAFIKLVNTLRNKKISTEQADQLIAYANFILDAI